jgi:quinolinate synthase
MVKYVDDTDAGRILLVTECSMSDNVQEAHPDKEMVRPCTLCPHMKKITLENTLASLQLGRYEVDVPTDIRQRAHQALARMLEIGRDD